ncbi:MAG: putative Ig domain-containing protein, partial [Pikeienuella sp.]
MTLPLDLSPYFSGAGLRYSATGLPAGLSIDPETGIVTGAFRATGVNETIVTATNAAGAASGGFTWRVEQAAAPEPPRMSAPPRISGAPEIGAALTASPGRWSGAPAFAFQWLRDGAPISRATGPRYVPVARDDLASLSVRVTATNAAGQVSAESAPVAVKRKAPRAAGALADRRFTLGSGDQSFDISDDFTDAEGGAWSISGAGAAIDAAGVATIPTDAPIADAVVTAAYANSGGVARSAVSVTVAAASRQ